MNSETHVLIGLPEAGKTTFLAALWYLATQSTKPKTLQMVRQSGDNTYLNEIRDHWVNASAMPRTAMGFHMVNMHLRRLSDERPFDLSIPDLSGEVFRAMWESRHLEQQTAESFARATGALLLLSSNKHKNPALLLELPPCDDHPDTVTEHPQQFSYDCCSSDAVLVDVLQMFAAIPETRPLPLAVVVSAWDVVETAGIRSTPGCWMRDKNFPLLWQFLSTNSHLYTPAYFGVSAQGGDITEDSERDDLLDKSPDDRPILVDDTGAKTFDISKPVCWLLDQGHH